MRKLIFAALFLALVPASNVQATEAQVDEGLLVNHLAAVSTPGEVWENGSRGYTFVRIGWPPADHLTVSLYWFGTVYDDAGNVLIGLGEYEIEIEDLDPASIPAVEKLDLRGLEKNRLRWVHPDACIWGAGCMRHTVAIDIRWKGYGPVTRIDRRDPVTGDGYVSYHRAASVKGEFTIDGMTVPGGDLDLGTGILSEERCFGDGCGP